jgi:hypothetical protein
MNPNKDFYYTIEAYLCDGLSPSEKKALENAMATNPPLKKQVEMQRLEWEGMECLVEADLRSKMNDWDAEMPFELPHLEVESPLTVIKEAAIVPMRPNYRWSIAASLILVSGALIGLWQWNQGSKTLPIAHVEPPKSVEMPAESQKTVEIPAVQPPQKLPTPPSTAQVTPKPLPESPKKSSVPAPKPVETAPLVVQGTPIEPVITPSEPQKTVENTVDYAALAAATYKTEPFEATEKTRGTEPAVPLTPAQEAYQQSNFKQVLSLLKDTPLEKEYVAQLNLLAHAYFQQKDFVQAIPLLEKVISWSRLIIRQEAEWYLLLNYLAQYPQYQTQFDTLAQQIKGNDTHKYQSKVIKLLETLNKK